MVENMISLIFNSQQTLNIPFLTILYNLIRHEIGFAVLDGLQFGQSQYTLCFYRLQKEKL